MDPTNDNSVPTSETEIPQEVPISPEQVAVPASSAPEASPTEVPTAPTENPIPENPAPTAPPEDHVIVKEVIKEVPVEKIVEKIVEVPVEKIVEKVVEVPVERVVERLVEVPMSDAELLAKFEVFEKEKFKEIAKLGLPAYRKLHEERKEKLYEYIKKSGEVTNHMARDFLHLSSHGALKYLQQLVKEGKIIRMGTWQRTKYKAVY